jgi:acetyltransferase-like isoleucine patch superfamily enzyme
LFDTSYIAENAAIFTESLAIGERSWIAGHALVRGDVILGDDCSINPYASVSGKVTCGNGVRIASHASIVGFNHGFDDPDRPIHRQGVISLGIVIGDDVWVGANCVILDGVTIGNGAVIAAGAVVTKDVPHYAIVAGVPAKRLRERFPATVQAVLEASRWWELDLPALAAIKPLFCSGGAKYLGKAEDALWTKSQDLLSEVKLLPAGNDAKMYYTNDYLPPASSMRACK